MLRILLMALVVMGTLHAEETEDFQPGDALYAPEEESPTAEQSPASTELKASYYSTARLSAVDFGHDMRPLEGAEIFLDGQFVGKSPLDLSGFLINKPALSLSARLPGYHDANRAALRIPQDGEARIVMVGENAASWYTTPSWILGLGLLAGAMAVYSQNNTGSSATGLALVGGGIGVIAISQAVARLFHLPGLDREVEKLNSKRDPLP